MRLLLVFSGAFLQLVFVSVTDFLQICLLRRYLGERSKKLDWEKLIWVPRKEQMPVLAHRLGRKWNIGIEMLHKTFWRNVIV